MPYIPQRAGAGTDSSATHGSDRVTENAGERSSTPPDRSPTYRFSFFPTALLREVLAGGSAGVALLRTTRCGCFTQLFYIRKVEKRGIKQQRVIHSAPFFQPLKATRVAGSK